MTIRPGAWALPTGCQQSAVMEADEGDCTLLCTYESPQCSAGRRWARAELVSKEEAEQ